MRAARNLVRFFEEERDAGKPFDMAKVQVRAATALGISLRALKDLVNGRERESASVPEVRDRGMNMVPSHCWTDGTANFEPDVPPGKGARWILIGAGTKDGWIHQSFVMWKGNVASEDYHSEMNAEIFEDWVKKRLLPFVPANAVLVFDRATYHTMLTADTCPATSSMSRAELAAWLVAHKCTEHGEELTLDDLLHCSRQEVDINGRVYEREGWSKGELLRVAQENKPSPKFRVVEWVEEYNKKKKSSIKVLFLPVAHPILNPIDLCWGHLKSTVRKQNIGSYEMEELKFKAQECQESEEQRAMWGKSYEHSYKYAVQQWKVDQLILLGDEEAEEMEAQELEEELSDEDD
jgi:transposase